MSVIDYYLLDYISSGNNQYINLGFKPICNSDRVEIHYYYNSTSVNQGVFGAVAASSSFLDTFSLNYINDTADYHSAYCGDYQINHVDFPKPSNSLKDFVVSFDKTGAVCNGTTYTMRRQTSKGELSVNNTLFRLDWLDWKGVHYFNGRVYYLNYYRNGSLIRQYVPAVSVSNTSLTGMYDLVNNVFYKSNTSRNFTKGNYQTATLTLSAQTGGSVSGGGSANKNVDGNARFSISATATSGYRFDGWYDGSTLISTSSSYNATINSNKTYTAHFSPNTKTITLSVNPSGAGNVSGGGTYNIGATATINAYPNAGYGFNYWLKNGSEQIEDNPYSFIVSDDVSLEANFRLLYNVSVEYDETYGTASWDWGDGNNVNLYATPNSIGQFKGWYVNNVLISSQPNTTYAISQDTTFEARFTRKYSITLEYDSDLGSATYTRDSEEQNIINLSVVSTITKFNGWYIGSTLLSYESELQYTLTDDSTIEARFEPLWEITTSVVGSGAIDYQRQSTNQNIVEFNVIPSEHYHFVKYVVDGVDRLDEQFTITLQANTSVIAYFEEDTKPHISVSTNIPNTSVYVSNNDEYPPYNSTIFARPYADYVFVRWSDGNTENPRELSVSQDITLVAEYNRLMQTNGIYQYRCFVKDQLNMTQPPKAFMVVDSFTLRQDYLTNATSKIDVLEIANDINNGDVIVVYNPKGQVIYNGVITSISDRTITTSQMQSFYKGTWIYNTHSSSTLEAEIGWLLGQYASGKIYRSNYTDPLVAQRLGGITIQTTNSTSAHLPSDLDKDGNEKLTQYDMEKFIYKLYADYQIIFEFEINMTGTNYVKIKVPTYEGITIGNNHYAIQNLSPVEKIEETNRLIIYWNSDDEESGRVAKTYRTTYVATKNGIVEQPSSTANRFELTNTKIVFSDDNVSDLVASNLPSQMYSHKITFTLLLKNSLYEYQEFILGMPIEVYYNGDEYYNSILTGRTITKASNQNVISVDYTCGLVRTALTKLITLKDLL